LRSRFNASTRIAAKAATKRANFLIIANRERIGLGAQEEKWTRGNKRVWDEWYSLSLRLFMHPLRSLERLCTL
jgi:hypothetical protein